MAHREEGPDAVDVGKKASFVRFLGHELHRGIGFDEAVELVPGLLLARHAQAQDNHAFVIFLFEDERRDDVAELEFLEGIERVTKFPAGDDAGGNALQVDE